VITLITTPQAARPRPQPLLPDPGARPALTALPALPLTTMPEQQIRRERLDIADPIELAETLTFLRHWISGRDHDTLAESLHKFIGVDGDHLTDLQSDLARFAFLLGDDDGERCLPDEPDSPTMARRSDPTTPDTGALRYAPPDV